MTRNEQSERDVGENLAEARALCERLDETLKNCASFFSGSFDAARDRARRAEVKEMEAEMREKEEALKEVREELVKYAPTPLWKVVTDKQYKDIFETHILSKLDDLSFRVFREVNTESRDACRRSGRKLRETFELLLAVVIHQWQRKRPLRSRENEAQYYFCSEAARTGNLALVRWLREVKKFDWNEWTINRAAQYGHLHIVTYCMEQKCPRGELSVCIAAKFGHLDILKYLHENGAPWDSWTCYYARENNHLECLVYALDNGCQNDKHVPQH